MMPATESQSSHGMHATVASGSIGMLNRKKP